MSRINNVPVMNVTNVILYSIYLLQFSFFSTLLGHYSPMGMYTDK